MLLYRERNHKQSEKPQHTGKHHQIYNNARSLIKLSIGKCGPKALTVKLIKHSYLFFQEEQKL